MADTDGRYAFLHGGAHERLRLDLFAARLDPVTRRRIGRLGLADIGADAELDVVQPGTDLAEFYQLSMAALAEPMISAGVMTADEAARLAARPADPDFLGCGFAFIGAWGRRPGPSA